MYCLVAWCPGVLINGFRGEPEEAVASGWSYLGPHCTRLCHLHHLQHAATCADCFLISFPSNSKQLFDRPCHCVIQGEVGTWEEYGLTDISIFEELSFRFYAFWWFICSYMSKFKVRPPLSRSVQMIIMRWVARQCGGNRCLAMWRRDATSVNGWQSYLVARPPTFLF